MRSPSSWHDDLGIETARDQQHGLPELWLVDTAASAVLVLRLSSPRSFRLRRQCRPDGRESLTSPQLPGFSPALDEVFTLG